MKNPELSVLIVDDRIHLSDLKWWENAVAKQYGVESIPANLLIGPDGKIIAKQLKGDQLQQVLENILK